MAYFVGADLGATTVRAAVATANGTIVAQAQQPTPQGPSGIAVTEAVLDTIRGACANAGVEPVDVEAVGVGSIGPLDLAAGIVDDPANLSDSVETVPLVGPISYLADSERVFLHNDAVAGVVGERFYADRTPDDLVYLTISSGIGAGVAVDGHVLDGWDGNAGEVGHTIVDPDGRQPCGCGRNGHWEAYCSGENIPAYARSLAAERDDLDTSLPLDDPNFDASHVFEYAGSDDFATDVVEQVSHWNAIGVTNLVQSYAPLVVAVGGSVALNNPEQVLDPIRERLAASVLNNVPEVQLTEFGDDVVLRGAVASALTSGTGGR